MSTVRILIYKPRSDVTSKPDQQILTRDGVDLAEYVFLETRYRQSLNESFDVYVHKDDIGFFRGNTL